MASQIGLRFQDQNFGLPHNGASAVGKTNAVKSQKKGGLGGRKPLGEISNSANIAPSAQASKKLNPKSLAFDKETSKISGKVQTRSRKALSDISNSSKTHNPEASKEKKKTMKLSAVEEDKLVFPSCISGERFLHDHNKCIAAMKHNDLREILATVGFSDVLTNQPESPLALKSSKIKAETRLFDPELEEIMDLIEEESLSGAKFNSPVCRSPEPPIYRDTLWEFTADFKLMDSP